MQYDLLIKNGYVVDYASAREGYFDVAVQNGMIAAVESSIGGSAVQELDASGTSWYCRAWSIRMCTLLPGWEAATPTRCWSRLV